MGDYLVVSSGFIAGFGIALLLISIVMFIGVRNTYVVSFSREARELVDYINYISRASLEIHNVTINSTSIDFNLSNNGEVDVVIDNTSIIIVDYFYNSSQRVELLVYGSDWYIDSITTGPLVETIRPGEIVYLEPSSVAHVTLTLSYPPDSNTTLRIVFCNSVGVKTSYVGQA